MTSSGSDPFEGNLDTWNDVQEAADWDAIVLGNGASINIWNDFQYGSLFEKAKQRNLFHKDDEALFGELGAEMSAIGPTAPRVRHEL